MRRCWANHLVPVGLGAHIPVNASSGEGRCEDDLREDPGLGADIPGEEGMLPPTRDLSVLQPRCYCWSLVWTHPILCLQFRHLGGGWESGGGNIHSYSPSSPDCDLMLVAYSGTVYTTEIER